MQQTIITVTAVEEVLDEVSGAHFLEEEVIEVLVPVVTSEVEAENRRLTKQ